MTLTMPPATTSTTRRRPTSIAPITKGRPEIRQITPAQGFCPSRCTFAIPAAATRSTKTPPRNIRPRNRQRQPPALRPTPLGGTRIVTPSGSRSTTMSLPAGRCGRLGMPLASTSLSTTVFGGGQVEEWIGRRDDVHLRGAPEANGTVLLIESSALGTLYSGISCPTPPRPWEYLAPETVRWDQVFRRIPPAASLALREPRIR